MSRVHRISTLCLVLSILFSAGSSAEKRALIIGISQYALQPRLYGPGNDIQLVQDLLCGWYGFSQQNVVVLRDSTATRANIKQEFIKLRKMTSGDTLAVYYSGHGTMAFTDGRIEEAIVPFDGDANRPGTLITTKEMRDWMQLIPAGQADVILDCCYSGGFVKEPGAQGAVKCVFPSEIPSDAIQVIDKTLIVSRPGHVVISASLPGTAVPDTEFPLVDGTRLRISALAFLMYRDLYRSPYSTHKDLVNSVRSLMSGWKLKQQPDIGGNIGNRPIFGGPVKGINPRTLPVSANSNGSIELMGGLALDLKPGTQVKCLSSRGITISRQKITGSNWRRAWLKPGAGSISRAISKVIPVR